MRSAISALVALVGTLAAAQVPHWPMPAKNFASTRYSDLDQITLDNAKDLKLAWSYDTTIHRGHEAPPIVVGDTMYVVAPYPNILFAFDLNKPGTVKWKYE